MGAFGDKFRKEREKKNISLDDVSNVTKIGSRMLKAIEQEQFDQLPGGVFNKGFIRAYAKQLGMNEEEAVNGYLECVRKSQSDANDVWEPPQATEKRAYAKPTLKAQGSAQVEELPELQLPRAEHVRVPRNKFLDERRNAIPWRLVAAALLVVVLASYLWIRRSRALHASAPPPMTQPAAATAPATDATHPVPANGSPVHSTAPNAVPAVANHASAANASKPAPGGTSSATPAALPPADAPSVTTAAPKPLTLVIRATENSWISVSADGELISQETLIAPAHASFRASREISVKVGNAAGVTFLWNGKEIPAQGAEAEARTLTFDASGLRSPQPAAPQAPSQTQTN